MFTLICARINGWANNREAGDLRRHRAHYDVTVMKFICSKSVTHYSPMEIMLCYQIESKPKASKMTILDYGCEICRRIRFFHVLSHFLSVTSPFSLYPCVDQLEFKNNNHVVLFRQWALRTTCMVTISNPALRPWHHSRLIPMYNARFILWPPSLSSPIRKKFFLNMGRERRWPRWIKKALHIGIKRLCLAYMFISIWISK